MVKKVFLVVLLHSFSFAASTLDIVERLLPVQTFDKNRAVLYTLFAQEKNFKRNGVVDYMAVFAALERVGIVDEMLQELGRWQLRFRADHKPSMLLYLVEQAMEKAHIYRYNLFHIVYEEQRILEDFQCDYVANISFFALIETLRKHAVVVKDVRFFDGGWDFVLDFQGAKLSLPHIKSTAVFRDIKEHLWLDVCGAQSVEIVSFDRFWHPLIAIYSAELAPLDLIKIYEVRKRLRVTLPNGACYIKISDIFTPKNIKHGFRVSLSREDW